MEAQIGTLITLLCLISVSLSNGLRSVPLDTTSFEPGTEACRRPGINNGGLCYALTNTSQCFGVRLNYTHSSPELAGTNYTLLQIQNELGRWEGIRNSPKCWNVIQQLLCAYFMPKCNHDGSIELPTQELCKITRSYCKVIEHIFKGWPDFLQCEDTTKFSNCKGTKNDNKEGPRFNSPSTCMEPMIQVNNPMNFYEGFEGCGLKCQNPLYTDEDHEYISGVIYYANIVSFVCTSIVAATFVLDWKSSNIYPTIIILFINICYSVATFGWLIQFLPNSKQDVVCKKDGTVRRNEYNSDENIFCFSGFLLIYIGSMAALAWLVVFAYVMHIKLSSKNLGEIRQLLDKKMYFHAFAWCVPFILSVLSSFVLRKLEGDTMSGICFIGYSSPIARVLLLLLPVLVLVLVMTFFLIKAICSLTKVANTAFITDDGKKCQVMSYIWRLKGFAFFAVLLIIAFIGLDIYQMIMRPTWHQSLRETLTCRLNLTEAADCYIGEKVRPGITEVTLLMVLFPIGGILVSSWAWTDKTFYIWKTFLAKVLCCRGCHDNVKTSTRTHPRANKHELIAKAYERRHEIPLNGGISISIDTPHDDLIGLNRMLDPTHLFNERGAGEFHSNMNHSEQNGSEISTTWAAALPHLVTRRNGIAPPASSNSVSCVSEDNSRRPSYDSQMSEIAARHLQNSTSDLEGYGQRRGRWYKFSKNWKSRRGHSNRGSSSSLESYGPPKIHSVVTAMIDKRFGRAGCVDNYIPNNQRIIVKELAIQTGTSIEKLSYLPCNNQNLCGPQGNLTTCDKQTQWSRSDLTEIGRSVETQTKKSFTKKNKKRKDDEEGRDNQALPRQESHSHRSDEAVKQLLLPGTTSK